MSDVSRSEYQKLVEENRRLKADIKILVINKDMAHVAAIEYKWKMQFDKDDQFKEALTAVAKQYFIDNPDAFNPSNLKNK